MGNKEIPRKRKRHSSLELSGSNASEDLTDLTPRRKKQKTSHREAVLKITVNEDSAKFEVKKLKTFTYFNGKIESLGDDGNGFKFKDPESGKFIGVAFDITDFGALLDHIYDEEEELQFKEFADLE